MQGANQDQDKADLHEHGLRRQPPCQLESVVLQDIGARMQSSRVEFFLVMLKSSHEGFGTRTVRRPKVVHCVGNAFALLDASERRAFVRWMKNFEQAEQRFPLRLI